MIVVEATTSAQKTRIEIGYCNIEYYEEEERINKVDLSQTYL